MDNKTTIKCPNCGSDIDVNDVLYHQLENELKRKFNAEVEAKRKEYKDALSKLKSQEEAIKKQREKFEDELKKATDERLKEEKRKLQEEIKRQLQDEQKESMELLKAELKEKSEQVRELNKSKIEIEKLKREKDEIELKIKAETELKLNQKLKEEREKLQKTIQEENELKFKQKEEQLKQLQEQLKIAQRKAEQGSMQLQGEVQELAIEEYLKDKFPLDSIEEIKKGARGGDCIQIVHTREAQNCGSIYYESKRTKEFQKSWIEKFKADMREKGVDVGVLVTSVYPSGMDRVGLVDGVWICSYEEFKGLCQVLRESIIKIHYAKKSQENKGDKMSLLYNYLTGNEFKMQVEAIVEGFSTMQSDLDKEKRAMAKIWKQREKQLEKVLENTIGLYGSIKGIAGSEIPYVKALELPYSDEE